MTARQLVKKALVSKGYPIQTRRGGSKFNSTIVANKVDGIELEREYGRMYSDRNRDEMIENLIVSTNGFITEEEVNNIIEESLKEYKPYKTEVKVYIY